jgi:ABC-2 type transport system permease protein
MLVETARLWLDLGFYSEVKGGKFRVNGVTGPDEYNAVVNNNVYTNLMTALGLFLGTNSQSMAQFALLIILVVLVLQLLSGGTTPVESQPVWLQYMTFFLPSTHFVSFSQKIIYRGGGIDAIWPQFLMVTAVGLAFFTYSLALFRKSIAVTK